jgi:hypothetical protein
LASSHFEANATERYREDGELSTERWEDLATGSWAVRAAVRGDPAGVTAHRRIHGKPCLTHHRHRACGVRCAWVFCVDRLDVDALGGCPLGDDRDAVGVLNGWALNA